MPAFLIQLLWALVISTVSRYFFTPDASGENAKPSALSDVDAPTISEGTTIPVIFGSVLTGRQNVTWYGGLSNEPITQSGVTTGYKYSLTVQSSLCFGPVDAIREVRFDDIVAATAPSATTADYWDYTINKPDLFGGVEKEGGVVGTMRIYRGTTTQTADPELNTLIGSLTPAFRRVCHAVMRNMYVGTSTRIKAPSFLVERCPRTLLDQAYSEDIGTGVFGPEFHRIGSNFDANPVCAIYEALTDEIWGAAMPRSQFDTASWYAAAATAYAEGLGLSTVLGSGETADALVKRLSRYLDALVFDDPVTGEIQIQLVRDTGVVGLPQFDAEAISAVNASRISWTELKTTTKVTYTDASRNYEVGGVMAQNSALVEALGGAVDTEAVDLPGFSSSTPSLDAATRLLRSMSYPLSKVEIEGDRSLASVRPGVPFHLTWDRPTINAYYRATEVDLGSPSNPFVRVTAIEDIFTAAANTFTAPPGSGFNNTGAIARPVTRITMLETPYHLRRNDARSVIFGAAAPSASHIGYHAIVNGSTADSATYGWMSSAALSTAIPFWAGETVASITLATTLPADVVTPTQGQYDAGESLLQIGSELLAYRTVTRNTNGSVTFGDVARAVLDTVPEAHSVGAIVTVLSTCRTRAVLDLGADGAVAIAAQSMTLADTQPIPTATSRALTTASRALRPYPPARVTLNGTVWGVTGSSVSPTITWEHRSRAQTVVLGQAVTTVTTEAGVEYVVRLYDATSGTLVDTVVTSATSVTVETPGEYVVRVHSRRDGLLSAQGYAGTVTAQAAAGGTMTLLPFEAPIVNTVFGTAIGGPSGIVLSSDAVAGTSVNLVATGGSPSSLSWPASGDTTNYPFSTPTGLTIEGYVKMSALAPSTSVTLETYSGDPIGGQHAILSVRRNSSGATIVFAEAVYSDNDAYNEPWSSAVATFPPSRVGEWTHLAAVFSDDGAAVYVDGQRLAIDAGVTPSLLQPDLSAISSVLSWGISGVATALVDSMRITLEPLYSGTSFTPPTGALPVIPPGSILLAALPATASETAGTVNVPVTLSAASTGTVTVAYATANGTATAGSDYTATSGTLTFAPGETSKTVAVTLTNDTAVETPETFTLSLSSPTGGAVLGPQSIATVTITSDDAPTGDAYWSDVKLLLHADGTTFADSSSVGRSPSSVAGIEIGASSGQFSGAIVRTSGHPALDYASSTDFALPGPWTIEFSVYATGLSGSGGNQGIFMGSDPASGSGPYMRLNNATLEAYGWVTDSAYVALTGFSQGVWNQIALTRDSGGTVRAFVNGALVASGSGPASYLTGAAALGIVSGHPFSGPLDTAVRLDEIRFTRACRYTAAYTPTTAPFPDSAT